MNTIGIDLGTTHCCMAIFRSNHVEIIPNENGNLLTPSYVAITEDGDLIGEPAKAQVFRNPKNTFYGIKRMIGRQFADATLQSDMKKWAFEVVEGEVGQPLVKAELDGETRTYTQEKIMAKILKNLKVAAEKYLEGEVKNAVLTVPSHFDESQRHVVKKAANMAGLTPIRITNESTTAFWLIAITLLVTRR